MNLDAETNRVQALLEESGLHRDLRVVRGHENVFVVALTDYGRSLIPALYLYTRTAGMAAAERDLEGAETR